MGNTNEFIWDDKTKIEFFEFAFKAYDSRTLEKTFEQFKLSKQRKPIFITNGDNEEVFEGDIFYTFKLGGHNELIEIKCQKFNRRNDDFIDFKSKPKAEQYKLHNAKVLSYNDVVKLAGECVNDFFYIHDIDDLIALENLVKSKL